MRHKRTKIIALVALALAVTTMQAQAANCQGRRDTGTAVGAIGGGFGGKAATQCDTGGTISGAVICGIGGDTILGGRIWQVAQGDPRSLEVDDTWPSYKQR